MRLPRLCTLCCLIMCFSVAGSSAAEDYVPTPLIEKAARFYGAERWPGCRLISVTPYYALDGSINAYAVQFARDEFSVATKAELSALVRTAEERLNTLREAPPVASKEAHPAVPAVEATFTVLEEVVDGSAPAMAYVPPSALEAAHVARAEALRAEQALREWNEEVRAAANAAVLADEVGTVIIAARYDLYPMLERFDGVAPHLKFESKSKALAGAPAKQVGPIERSFYLGPCSVFHEMPADGVSALIDPISSRVVTLKETFAPGEGKLPAAPVGKLSIGPKEFWRAIESSGVAPATGPTGGNVTGSSTIAGVPYYHQDDYGANSRGPTASAQALGYWDDNGYGNLVDNGSSTTGHEEELVYSLMRAQSYDPNVGTYGSKIEPGIEAVCNTNAYGNDLSFDVTSDYSVAWSDITGEINANRPFVYFNWDTDKYPYWAHFTTGTGYNDNSGHKLYVHYNYPPDSPYEMNWDNIPSDNESMYKITAGPSAFDCIWSEDFEGTFPGSAWAVGYNGSSAGSWDDTSYRSHNVTTDPSPPGGNTSWSGYCVDTHVSPPGPYPHNVNGWMIRGPFSTVGKTQGEIAGYLWRYITDGIQYDYVGLFASIDGTNFYGNTYAGDYRSWNRVALDLTNVYTLGCLMGQSQVWVAVWFHSDGSVNSEGAYIDNITTKLALAPPNVPTGVVATDGTYTDKVRITWTASCAASHYRVYRATSAGGAKTAVSPFQTSTTFDDATAIPGVTYYYFVTAATSSGGANESGYSSYDTGWRALSPPSSIAATDGPYTTHVYMDWTSVSGASHYRVYRATSAGGTKTAISSWQSGLNYSDSSATPGVAYYYFVTAAVDSSGSRESGYSSYDTGWRALSPPSYVGATDGGYTDKVVVDWTSASGASHYRVFRATSAGGTKSAISSWQTGLSFNDTTATPGVDYYYFVKSAVDSAGSRESDYSGYDSGWRALSPPSSISATDWTYTVKIRITWSATTGANYYRVYRATSAGGTKTAVGGWTSSTSFDDTSASPAQTYYYWLTSATTSGGARESDYSTYDTGVRALPAPTGVAATDGTYTDKVRVTWNSQTGATHYCVYRSDAPDGTKTTVMDWQAVTTFDDVPASPGSDYYYWVTAATSSSGANESDYSAYDTGWRALAPPTNVAATDGSYTDRVRVTCNTVVGAGYYRFWRATSPGGTKTVVGSWQLGAMFDDLSVSCGITYYYWATAARDASGTRESAFSSYDSGYSALAAPTGVAATDGSYTDRVDIAWNAVLGATHYKVYRSTSSGGTKTGISGWQTGLTYSDTSATPGTNYYYWVTAATSSSGANESGFSTYDTGWRALSPPGGVTATDGLLRDKVRITWNPAAGASYYRVYRSNALGGVKTALGDWQSGTSYDDAPGYPGIIFYYWVTSATSGSGYRESSFGGYDTGSVGTTMTIMGAKSMPDHYQTNVVSGVVTAVFWGWFYIESPDRVGAICVAASPGVQRGMMVDIVGEMNTNWEMGERFIDAYSVLENGQGSVAPLCMSSRSLGGADFLDPCGGTGQWGVRGAIGPNNVGTLVTICGTVGHMTVGEPFCFVDDGCGLMSWSGQPGVYVTGYTELWMPESSSRVSVTGISSLFGPGESAYPMIIVRDEADIVYQDIDPY